MTESREQKTENRIHTGTRQGERAAAGKEQAKRDETEQRKRSNIAVVILI